MNSILPNMRLLCLASESEGHDWYDKVGELDQGLEGRGMDLAEESVYLLFSAGRCLVARSVIGPKKEMELPFHLIDWVAAPVWRERIAAKSWDETLEKAQKAYEEANKGPRPLSSSFMLKLNRHLKTGLILETEALFSE